MRTRCASIFSALILLSAPFAVEAQDGRSFSYDTVRVDIEVQQDASIFVHEELTYGFIGEYHKGFRSIPLKGIGTISAIEVVDSRTGEAYVKSADALEKTNPQSWGKFYTVKRNGAVEIEWYFSATDEIRSWTIQYRASGTVSFLKDKDELYWNVFSGYDAPVATAEAVVRIPQHVNKTLLSAAVYVNSPASATYTIESDDRAHFWGSNFNPGTPFTIALGWPKGIVLESEYRKDFIFENIAVIVSIIVVLGAIVIGILYWYFTERFRRGRGTIVPEYEPPKSLPPAMAEVIVKETVTTKAWAASVVDLAVRGYVTITEEPATVLGKIGVWVLVIFFLGFSIVPLLTGNFLFALFPLALGALIVIKSDIFSRLGTNSGGISSLLPKDYSILLMKPFEEDNTLRMYEREFLTILFGAGKLFSTSELKTNKTKARRVYQEMRKLEEKLYKEVESETGAFEKPISRERWRGVLISLCLLVIFGFIALANTIALNDMEIIGTVLLACSVFLFLFIFFEARLSKEGAIFREEWLGFKLYLETAEKYRLQNLTPELFEKFLPYAIIFGVEKKWGKAFDSISINPPAWYAGAATSSFSSPSGSVSSIGGFSASAFSASFASSFSSSFASSGAGGGASGGGGGAGGGGGGGGGGAS